VAGAQQSFLKGVMAVLLARKHNYSLQLSAISFQPFTGYADQGDFLRRDKAMGVQGKVQSSHWSGLSTDCHRPAEPAQNLSIFCRKEEQKVRILKADS
jgi:hypothetical protein